MKSGKFWVLVLLLAATTVLLRVRGDVDRVPVSQPLSEIPKTIGPWTAVDLPLDDRTLEVLGKGIFLNRAYMPTGADQANPTIPAVGLFIGYFPTQRTGQSIHSPQHCLPGAGWNFDSSGLTTVKGPNGNDVQVGEYVISNGASRAEVLYWYQSHGRSIADDYKAKLYTVTDSLRYGRTDAALIRIVTTIGPHESKQQAHERAVSFANMLDPMLPAYIPN